MTLPPARTLPALAVPALALVLAGCGGASAAPGTAPAEAAGTTVTGAAVTEAPLAEEPPVPEPASAPVNGATLDVDRFAAAVRVPGTVVLDVRTPAEFAEGHLEGAQNLDASSPGFTATLELLDPDDTYAVYCRSGSRSAAAMQQMLDRGFTAVYHLDGGIGAWTAAGRPTVR
ncbi:rhodanese-like domain-containing protein [Ornithinimicrobium pekingense]|uniref:Rhodanese domain-containing protein n=1 Tax=Ornithinimicrobium pekingense TaxID=384677 RepID=A0ABQ2FAG4_9MICO|nr:rhodanese-like domain-containing protein [Ornithinimicrobium pekingense]GGK73104.1 hypothetical protein GCM10011509_22150 [Ornithinimicrobium pekingense]